MRKTYTAVIFFLLAQLLSFAQTKNDTTAQPDSLKIYKSIKTFASKKKITYWIYKAVFTEPPAPSSRTVDIKPASDKVQDQFSPYKGKVIRKLDVVTYDPFGISKEDTVLREKNFFLKAGNRIHIRTRRITVKNQLLFKKGDRLDPLSLKESERILRQSAYAKEALIRVKPVSKESDSVDVTVYLYDLWTITGTGAFSTSANNVRLIEKNFLGFGHRLENTLSYNFATASNLALNGNYQVPYIRNTFITATAYYSTAVENSYRGFNVERTFFSPLTIWAGGLNLVRTNTRVFYPINEGHTFPLQYTQYDLWAGRSLKFIPGKTDVIRSSKITLTGRVYAIRYLKRAPFELDTLRLHQDATLYLGSIGYSSRNYYKEKNIYRFERTEDVPEGRLLAFIGGYETREFGKRYYTGIRIGTGSRVDYVGYVSGGLEYGTFWGNKNEKGVVKADIFYFSDLMRLNNWGIRQFFYHRITHGINRLPVESININHSNGLYGFSSDLLTGTSKTVLNLETVIYTPWRLLGFRFGTVLFTGFGMLGNDFRSMLRSRIYQVYGLGVLVRNENLIVNTFQFSLGLYPFMPGREKPLFKFNPISSYHLRMKDFEISKPDLISFQ